MGDVTLLTPYEFKAVMRFQPNMPETRSIAPVLVAGFALLGGCAQLEWHKTDATAEARERDLADCTAQARIEARRMPALQSPAPQVVIDNQGRAVAVRPPNQNNERFLAEHDFMRACMRERGYVLRDRATATP